MLVYGKHVNNLTKKKKVFLQYNCIQKQDKQFSFYHLSLS